MTDKERQIVEAWKGMAADHPTAWRYFVEYFQKKSPALYNHSDCWVLDITAAHLIEFSTPEGERQNLSLDKRTNTGEIFERKEKQLKMFNQTLSQLRPKQNT